MADVCILDRLRIGQVLRSLSAFDAEFRVTKFDHPYLSY